MAGTRPSTGPAMTDGKGVGMASQAPQACVDRKRGGQVPLTCDPPNAKVTGFATMSQRAVPSWERLRLAYIVEKLHLRRVSFDFAQDEGNR